ncbi:MAG: hypothetical protein LBJ90_06090 [Treponema sp.]|jgi:hypothetical protein|nr:hypothetical protein [Treponema sp.]
MPDLSQEWAIVISTGIGGLISVISVAVTLRCNRLQRQDEFEEKMYFERFHKRISVYEYVLNILSRMRTNKELPPNISLNDIKVKFSVYTHVLDILEVKLSLFESPVSVKIIRSLKDRLCEDLVNHSGLADVACARNVRTAFMGSLWKALSEFTNSARAETPVRIVDEFTHHSGSRIEMIGKRVRSGQDKRKGKHRENNNNERN